MAFHFCTRPSTGDDVNVDGSSAYILRLYGYTYLVYHLETHTVRGRCGSAKVGCGAVHGRNTSLRVYEYAVLARTSVRVPSLAEAEEVQSTRAEKSEILTTRYILLWLLEMHPYGVSAGVRGMVEIYINMFTWCTTA